MAHLLRRIVDWLGRSAQNGKPSKRGALRGLLSVEPLENRLMPTVRVTYHEGFFDPVLTHVQVATVYYGSAWRNNAALSQTSQVLDGFVNSITNSAYMDLMREYYEELPFIGNVYVGHGSWRGHDFTPADPPAVVTDAQIQSTLWSEIHRSGGAPPTNDWQSLYFVFLPPNVKSYECQQHNWGAYHSAFERVIGKDSHGLNILTHVTYAVVPWPNANYAPGSANALQWQEISASHELAEAITNPGNALGGFTNFGGSWYADGNQFADRQGREIGDLAAPPNLKFGKFNGYWVQALWTNNQSLADQRILPAGTTNVWAEGNGKGVFPPGQPGVGFSEDEDPLAGHLPAARFTPTYTANPGQVLTVAAGQGLLTFFSDPNRLPLQARLQGGPSHGQLALNLDGSFRYTPSAGFFGTDSFVMEASDGEFQSNPTTVVINVVLPAPSPIAPAAGVTLATAMPTFQWSAISGAAYYNVVVIDQANPSTVALSAPRVTGTSWTFSTPLTSGHSYSWYVQAIGISNGVPWGGLSSNAVFFRVSLLGVPTLIAPTNGATVITASPTLQWSAIPGAAGYVLYVNDAITHMPVINALHVSGSSHTPQTPLVAGHAYQWWVTAYGNSGEFGPAPQPFLFTIARPPIAADDAYTVGENATLQIGAPGILANDRDPDGRPLQAVLVSGPAHGVVSLKPDGSFVYTPNRKFAGADTFRYKAVDGVLESGIAAVSITVTGPPPPPEETFVISADAQVYALPLDARGNPVGGYFLTQPGSVKALAVGRDAGGRPEVFVIGLDNQVYAQRFDDRGFPASGYFLAAPGQVKALAVGSAPGHAPELFVIGLDNQVYAERLDASGNPVGGYFLTRVGQVKSLAVGQDAQSNPELFVIGLDNQVYAQRFDDRGFSAGGYFLTQAGQVLALRVGQDAGGDPELFVLGLDHQVYGQKLDAQGQSASGYFLAAVGQVQAFAVGQDAAGEPELLVIGLDQQVYAAQFTAGGIPATGYVLTQPGQVKALSLGQDAFGDPELFVIGLDQQVYGQHLDGQGHPASDYFFTQPGHVTAVWAMP
jgi:hypothetical protein